MENLNLVTSVTCNKEHSCKLSPSISIYIPSEKKTMHIIYTILSAFHRSKARASSYRTEFEISNKAHIYVLFLHTIKHFVTHIHNKNVKCDPSNSKSIAANYLFQKQAKPYVLFLEIIYHF